MKGSVYRQCFCRDPQTKKRYKTGECPAWGKKGHGRWYFKYDAPVAPGEKRRQPEAGPFATRKEAEEDLAGKLAAAGSGHPMADRALKVGTYLDTYLAGKRTLKARTRQTDAEAYELYWKPALGDSRLADVRDHHVSQVLTAMRQINRPLPDGEKQSEMLRRMTGARADDVRRVLPEGEKRHKKSRRPLSPARIERMYAPFRAAMNAAVRTGKIGRSPCLGVELDVPGKIVPLAWTPARVARFQAAFAMRLQEAGAAAPPARVVTAVQRQDMWDDPSLRPCPVMVWMPEHTGQFLDHVELTRERLAALFTVAAFCGLRAGELIGLAWPQVEVGNRILWVLETSSGDGPKSEAGRRPVPLQASVVEALEAWREVQELERQLRPDEYGDTDLVFTHENGSPLTHQWMRMRFETLSYRAGVPPIRFHDLRHGTASLLKASGADSKMIATVLGHARSDFTDRVYVTLFPEVQAAAAEAAAAIVPRAPRAR